MQIQKKYDNNDFALPPVINNKLNNQTFDYWRVRIMYAMIIGYMGFYLLRHNFSFASVPIMKEFGYSKIQLGAIISVTSIVYGVGKAFAGFMGDYTSPRILMTIGLVFSALVNFFMGFGESLTWFMIFWTLNHAFQSFGWPPCARLLNHWYSPKELATKWALWNTSQQIGAGIVAVTAPFIIAFWGWRALFYVPGIICVVIGIFLYNRLRDTPQSLGLPSIEAHHGLVEDTTDHHLSMRDLLIKRVLSNKLVWYMCFANFFVYFVRATFFAWAPTFLQEAKGSTLYMASCQDAVYHIAGIVGGLFAGYLSDKTFRGYRGRVACLFMLGLCLSIAALWLAPVHMHLIHYLAMLLVGFFITGPQVLVGVAASDFSSKRAAGTATGLTGTFGYIGTALAGAGVAAIADEWGWNAAFMILVGAALCGAVFFALTWFHRSKALT